MTVIENAVLSCEGKLMMSEKPYIIIANKKLPQRHEKSFW